MNSSDYWYGVLAEVWGLGGRFVPLPGEYDLNFRLDGQRAVVFKVMRPGCDRGLVDLQVALHRHLSTAGSAGFPVPAIVPTRSGEAVVEVADETGAARLAWAIECLDGMTLDRIRPRDPGLFEALGGAIAEMASCLKSFDHPALDRSLKWDLRRAAWILDHVGLVGDRRRRDQIVAIVEAFESRWSPLLRALPAQAIHNDLNDHNLLAKAGLNGIRLTGVIDFGDAIRAPVLCELAIAGAYAALETDRPLEALAGLLRGFAAVQAVSDDEADAVWPLVLTRLAVSVVNCAKEKQARPDDPYVAVSERSAWWLLDWARDQDPEIIRAVLRRAAGLDPCPEMTRTVAALGRARPSPVFTEDLFRTRVADVSVAGQDAPTHPEMAEPGDFAPAFWQRATRETPLIGRYAEPRMIYTAPMFRAGAPPAERRRTVHLGLDVFLPAGTGVAAPLDGVVSHAGNETGPQDYGGLVVLEHELEGARFCTLYGHLAPASFAGLAVGDQVTAGQVFAALGTPRENGGWPPHLHLQLGLPEQAEGGFAGVFEPDLEDAATSVHPNPARLLGLDPADVEAPRLDRAAEQARRARHVPRNLKLSYSDPVPVLRGLGTYLYDDRGRAYLDAYNNVPHVGHAHPRVADAVARQLRLVNTNTRYLQPIWSDYAEALTGLMPDGLDVVFCVNSGSEANDLALRIARACTGGTDVVVSRSGYHGITQATIDVSEYKFAGKGGSGRPEHVRVAEVPDLLRGSLGPHPNDAGPRYAADVARCIKDAEREGRRVAAFLSEPFPSVGGQIVPPQGYLATAYDHVRRAGGLCIADEVQTGLWRLGTCRWGFEQQGAHPDIVVLGKPVANGHPMGVVVTTREIANAFATGMEFFSTFGGSSVSCAAALAVLDVLREERLPEQVARVGGHLLEGLQGLADRFPLLADVRGLGLFVGVDLARPDGTPATEAARYITERLRDRRVLIGTDGPHDNVLKIRPPLVFTDADADFLLARLEEILGHSALATFMRRLDADLSPARPSGSRS